VVQNETGQASITRIPIDTMIYPVVRLLISNLVHVVTRHSLDGSRANRHYTLALHKGAVRTT
jgi:hypothetical protein